MIENLFKLSDMMNKPYVQFFVHDIVLPFKHLWSFMGNTRRVK